ncbi:MAG: PulJ/GspJ family protein [Gammaproteobacteria bacterium]
MQPTTHTAPIARTSGFTLIELVIVIVVAGIIAGISAGFITSAMEGYVAQGRRATLVDTADLALTRMTRDLRQALPNSVRVADSAGNTGQVRCQIPGQICGIEFLHVLDGGRYRAKPPGNPLAFNQSSDTFDVLGGLSNLPPPSQYRTGTSSAQCLLGNAWCLVIYNAGQPASAPVPSGKSANAYLGPGSAAAGYVGNIATISAITGTPPDSVSFDNSDLDSPPYRWHFPFRSPQQRFYIVDTPVSYICDLSTGEVRRYTNYPIGAVHAVNPAAAPLNAASSALLANKVSSCAFDYQPGTSTRSGLVTLTLAITDSGETVALFQQVHVVNAP